jgi:hypothetical protein
MEELLKKLNYKNHRVIALINIPNELNFLKQFPNGYNTIDFEINAGKNYDFLLLFVQTEAVVSEIAIKLKDNMADDAVLWFIYPKKTSKKYKSEINRDSGWQSLSILSVEPVRMVSMNEDWSALRFRQVSKIKTMKRKGGTISKEGAERISSN